MIRHMMKKREKILSKIIQMLDFSSLDPTTFANRLIYQKTIYLLQFSGISLGYRFNWYIRGPYSPELTETIYKIDNDKSIFPDSSSIRFKNQNDLEQKTRHFLEALGENAKNPEFLEILASLAYIRENDPAYRNFSNNLKIRLLNLKPFVKDFDNFDQLYDSAIKSLRILSEMNA